MYVLYIPVYVFRYTHIYFYVLKVVVCLSDCTERRWGWKGGERKGGKGDGGEMGVEGTQEERGRGRE